RARRPTLTLFPYTTLFRSGSHGREAVGRLGSPGDLQREHVLHRAAGQAQVLPEAHELPGPRADFQPGAAQLPRPAAALLRVRQGDRKSTRLNSSHVKISYA